MFQSLYYLVSNRIVLQHNGVESKELLRRYEHAQALREIKREARIRDILADGSQGFVERIRTALGIA